MSMPVGHTATHRPQSTQSPVVLPSLPRGSPRLASYPITRVSESNSTPWKRAYGQRTRRRSGARRRSRGRRAWSRRRESPSRSASVFPRPRPPAAGQVRRNKRRDGSPTRQRRAARRRGWRACATWLRALARAPARPALDEPRNPIIHIGNHGLRTSPAAPESPSQCREEEQRQREADHDQPEEVELLREDHEPEHMELARRNVETHQRLAADLIEGTSSRIAIRMPSAAQRRRRKKPSTGRAVHTDRPQLPGGGVGGGGA